MSTEKIGFIGLGNMGHPMAKNLEQAGFNLSVYNRNAKKTVGFEDSTYIAQEIGDLVKNSDIIVTMLTNDKAVETVYQQIAEEQLQGKLLIDMSTISQKLTLSLAELLQHKGASLIDAPVAGSTQPAKEGTLIVMAGGHEKDIERALPYLEKMGKKIKHLGPNGSGIAAKIALNYFLSILYQGLAEATLLADHFGIARESFLEIVNESASGSGATKVKTPLLLTENYQAAFALDLMLKDILLAKDAGIDYPLGNAAVDTYQKAQEKGLGSKDVISVIELLKLMK